MFPERQADVPDARVTYFVREILDDFRGELAAIRGDLAVGFKAIEDKLGERVTLAVFAGLGKDLQELRRDLVGRLEALEDAEAARLARSTGVFALLRQVGSVGGWVMAIVLGTVSILDKVGVL